MTADKRKTYRKFLHPDVVSRLANMNLRARLVVEGFIIGLHRSPYHGFSVEFSEHRQYMPGDEPKRIDWKVYGKTNRFYIKQFEEETNLKSYILLDASASMGYKSGRISKLTYASYLAASLTYLMLRQQDSVGLVTFDQKIRKYIPPRAVSNYLNVILGELDKIRSGHETNISETFHELAERIKRRGLIIVLSDLFDDPHRVLSGLKHFRHKKHEVLVFHILDPMERSFNFKGETVFKDMETGDEISTQAWHIRKDYREQMQEFIETYKRHCLENRIDYVLIDTSEPFDKALFDYLIKRKRIGG